MKSARCETEIVHWVSEIIRYGNGTTVTFWPAQSADLICTYNKLGSEMNFAEWHNFHNDRCCLGTEKI
jgi:hypothetical protein